MTADEIAHQLAEAALTLESEALSLGALFKETSFRGNSLNMPHAHHGYVMATLGQIDALAACWCGTLGTRTQTSRMHDFLDTYMYPGRRDVHRAVVQMLRHSLMHTGALRYIYDRETGGVLTWRVFFGALPTGLDHYTVTKVPSAYQEHMLGLAAAAGYTPTQTLALNISLETLTKDLVRAAGRYTAQMVGDDDLQAKALQVFPHIQVQAFGERPESSVEGGRRRSRRAHDIAASLRIVCVGPSLGRQRRRLAQNAVIGHPSIPDGSRPRSPTRRCGRPALYPALRGQLGGGAS
ncbi:MAG: hypothetical protein M3256_25180 [Actinomycetota bacterium]|nr:hypothetical protein [Actinomycetota bacterium]